MKIEFTLGPPDNETVRRVKRGGAVLKSQGHHYLIGDTGRVNGSGWPVFEADIDGDPVPGVRHAFEVSVVSLSEHRPEDDG